MEIQQFKECKCKMHKTCGSKYDKEHVPVNLFQNPKSYKPFDFCLDCRLYARICNRKNYDKVKNNIKTMTDNCDISKGFKNCTHKSHSTNGSIYEVDKVPLELFRKIPENPRSPLLNMCKNCRDIKRPYFNNRTKLKKELSVIRGKFYCSSCSKEKDNTDRAINNNGKTGNQCKECKIKKKERGDKLRLVFMTLKYEFFEKYQSCCNICNSIYLSDKDSNKAVELSTYLKENIRYINYNNQEFISSEFITLFKDLLEMNIYNFDHLSEEEQRGKGLLLSHEIFVPKKCNVWACSSEDAMRLESMKCQLLCVKCHTIETIKREKGPLFSTLNAGSYLTREKLDYTNNLKLSGCENCGYKNASLPRFFDFDHIDPVSKNENIAWMVSRNYTLDDLKLEISK